MYSWGPAIASDRGTGGWLALYAVILLLQSFAAANAEDATLYVTPRLCVLDKTQEECRVAVNVRWSSIAPQSVCLYQGGVVAPLECWRQARHGELSVNVETGTNVRFELRDLEHQQLVADDTLRVVQEKELRRRRRNPWTFF